MASTSTAKPKKQGSPLDTALAAVPAPFRAKLINSYLEVKRRHNEARYDSAGMSAGKFCETVLRLLQHQLTGSHTPFGQRITNFADECTKLEQTPKTAGVESLRLVIPRAILFVYTLRNKRGIGHVGGDVDPNKIDSATIARIADWVICELVRVFHNLSLEEAEALVESISERHIQDIWEIAGKKRVLRADLNAKQKVLLLLYSSIDAGVAFEDLVEWTKYSNPGVFRSTVIQPLDRENLVEYDRESQFVFISPVGIKEVEENLLRKREP